ncbi:hypothetical protein BDN72DRAFT_757762 [Pluteus cervinus]|uniref:Uncharacterized protein n=1 Tax=Pluteus cervinus TaxID=181527 RepID=A0ACD3BCW6_9AGAR|nr:hypothetical protein BDN72DRAFT_757762 [Pluteus cervinus]
MGSSNGHIPSISGSNPGLLDPTQPSRLLRVPGSTLSFAHFDPRTATAPKAEDITKLSIHEELYRPKRIVLETTPTGGCSWRFVPNARRDDGVPDEGDWPRQIELCGEIMSCSQEQWDIYKLDPLYKCYVRAPPALTTITRIPISTPAPPTPSKRRVASPTPDRIRPRKKVRTEYGNANDSDFSDDDDIEEMAVDSDALPTPPNSQGDSGQPRETPIYTSGSGGAKRTRRMSPSAAQKDLQKKRTKQTQEKHKKRMERLEEWRKEKMTHFMKEIYEDAQLHGNGYAPRTSSGNRVPPSSEEFDEQAHQAALEESRRKIAELESDRPLWEEKAKRRKLQEQEQLRREAELKAAAERQSRMQREREREEALRTQQENERRERERRARQQRWTIGPWTTQRALERYRVLSESFDNTKFGVEEPLSADLVPWPVLQSPARFSIEDVDWTAVEKFFETVKPHMRAQDFKVFVEKSHRRFHPDRWRSRSLLKSVMDEAERGCMEVGKLLWLSGCNCVQTMRGCPRPKASLLGLCATETVQQWPQQAQQSHDTQSSFREGSGAGPSTTSAHPSTSPRISQSGRSTPGRVWSPQPAIAEHPDDNAILTTTPRPTTASADTQGRVPLRQHNRSLYSRTMAFFGYGRGASRARRSLVALLWNIAWGFVQIVVISTLLGLSGSQFKSPTTPGLTEWQACNRPLGVWASLWVVRVAFASGLTYWGYLRDRQTCNNSVSSEPRPSGSFPTSPRRTSTQSGTPNGVGFAINTDNEGGTNPEQPTTPLPHTVLYSRLTVLSSLMTLSWFLTAHILEYTSVHTCRFAAPHLWWLIFGILCIMYLMVLEVLLLGFVVFIIAPILFLIWNIFLICFGRHPLQNPTMIKPEIGKLSKTIVDKIPLVMYIPPPPESLATIKIASPPVAYSYPPKPTPSPPKRRFRFIRIRRKSPKNGTGNSGDEKNAGQKDPPSPETWEDHWEHAGYPFVILEGNRAACAICLMDFEEPKRIISDPLPSTTTGATSDSVTSDPKSPTDPSSSTPQTIPVEQITEEDREELKLTDAGEGAQPLRLLACGHVFHKTCLDPWLTDVSGRCPVCQRAVEIPEPPKKSRQRNLRQT